MSNPIPSKNRVIIRERDAGLCVRCGVQGAEVHHRRSRRVNDPHQHCPCVLVYLCRTCHEFVTVNPTRARGEGLVVSTYQPEPFTVAVRTYGGWQLNRCDGTVEYLNVPRGETP